MKGTQYSLPSGPEAGWAALARAVLILAQQVAHSPAT